MRLVLEEVARGPWWPDPQAILVSGRLGFWPWALMVGVVLTLILPTTLVYAQGDPALIFAVITSLGKDRQEVKAQVYAGGKVLEAALIPTDSIKNNLAWKKLELCHALRAEAWETPEGFRLATIRALDAGMLPMSLQGLAGDCLLKKALEFAPLVD